jgi:hypothetical protein
MSLQWINIEEIKTIIRSVIEYKEYNDETFRIIGLIYYK